MFRKTRARIVILIMIVSIVLIAGMFGVIYAVSRNETSSRNRELLKMYIERYELDTDEETPEETPEETAEPEVLSNADNLPDTGNIAENDTPPDIDNLPDVGENDTPPDAGEIPDIDSAPDADNPPDTDNLPDTDTPPDSGDIPDDRPRDDREMHEQEFELSTFYSVYYDATGEAVEIDNGDSAIYSDETVLKWADDILADGGEYGQYMDLYYMVDRGDDYTLVVLINNMVSDDSFSIIFKYALIFGSLTLVIIFVLACFLSKKIVKPLEENDKKQKQFVSDAGHELKTPLAVISTNAEMIQRELGENKWLSNIRYETARMAVLVQQLMTLAKTESAAAEMSETDFTNIILSEALSFEAVAFDKGYTLNCEDVRQNISINGNKEQLSRLAAIFIDNAIEHGEGRGDITVRAYTAKGKVHFSVSNEGAPIPDEQKTRLFDRFYRGDYGRSRESGHYGLGLAIAKAIVDAHRGVISVSCENGRVTFEAVLPAERKN